MVKYFYGQPRAECCHSILLPGLFDNYVENGRLKNSITLGSFTQSSEQMRHRDPGLIQNHLRDCTLNPMWYKKFFIKYSGDSFLHVQASMTLYVWLGVWVFVLGHAAISTEKD